MRNLAFLSSLIFLFSASVHAGCTGGGGLQANTPASCGDCPQICRTQNPSYGTQCSKVNIALILDESGSVCDNAGTRNPARSAIKSFMQGLLNLTVEGAIVNIGIVSFAVEGQVDFVYQRLTSGLVSSVNAWVDGTNSPSGTTGYCVLQNLGTSWYRALDVAKGNFSTQANPPDLYLWFTDGRPEYDSGALSSTCNNTDGTCYSESNAYFDNICRTPNACVTQLPGLKLDNNQGRRGTGAWAGAYRADQIKALGAKLFLVGVGNVLDSEDVVQLVTGPKRWDGTSSNFGTSDYLVSGDLTKLGDNLTAVLKGICPFGVNYNPEVPAGAIAGAVIAGVVVAAVIAAAIIAYCSYKSYKYYQLKSDMGSGSVQMNQGYVDRGARGEIPYSAL